MSKVSGPWIVGKNNTGPVAGTIPVTTPDYFDSYRNGMLIASVYGTESFSEANAHLIAAAPDLLEVAEMVLATADINTPHDLIDAATKAVAKAKGVEV